MTKQENEAYLLAACKIYGYPWELAYRQIKAESAFNNSAQSPAGAKGLCQFIKSTWDWTFSLLQKRKDLYRFGFNNASELVNDRTHTGTSVACYFLLMDVLIPRQLKAKKLRDSQENRLRAYNAGASAVLKSKTFKETNNYVAQILGTRFRKGLA